MGFQLNFLTQYQKASTFYSAKILSQVDSKFADHVLQGIKKGPFL
jgi:hypothetical protein